MKKRDLIATALLFIFTFGIYALIWTIKFHIELREKSMEGMNTVGHVLLVLFTFGVYPLYWLYASGKRLAKLGEEDNAGLYLLLGFLAPGIAAPLLMQSQANRIAVKDEMPEATVSNEEW